MKITKSQLKQLIKEELLREDEERIDQTHQKLNQAMELIETAYAESDANGRRIVGSVVDELYSRFGRHPEEETPGVGELYHPGEL